MAEGRKIAAILVADIVGYSRLTGVDEEGTIARLRALREGLFNPTIDAHGGRVVKRTGDGVIVEFRSVVEAVRCALDVTNGLAQRNADAPADRRIEVRTGVHLGDVIEEADGDLMGDGVNIAARLEGIAAPGGICLSEDAWRQVRDKLPDAFVDLGERQLKNISRPMRVYALGDADGAAPAAAPPSAVVLDPSTPPPPAARHVLTAAAGVLENVGRLVAAYADRAVTARSGAPLVDPPDRDAARRMRKTRDRTYRRTIIAAAILVLLAARACHGPQIASPPHAERSHAGDVR
jgi:class 3 adenylate cyclase